MIGTHKTQCIHKMRLQPFKPQQPLEDITVHDADLYSCRDSNVDADLIKNNTPSQDISKVDNNDPQHIMQNLGTKERTVHITDNDVINLQPPTTQINQQTTGQPNSQRHQSNNGAPNTDTNPPTNTTANSNPTSLPQQTLMEYRTTSIITRDPTPPETST